MTVEYKDYLIDFNPAGPSRELRFKVKGNFGSIDLEQFRDASGALLKKIDNVAQYQVPGKTYDGRPEYFAQKRFFLISLEPSVLVAVPNKYIFGRNHLSPNNPSLRNYFNSAFHALDESEEKAGRSSMVVGLRDWINYVELKAVFPDVKGIEVITEAGTQSISHYLESENREFDFRPSERFLGHMEAFPRSIK